MRKSILWLIIFTLVFFIALMMGFGINIIQRRYISKDIDDARLANENITETKDVVPTSGAENVVSPNSEQIENNNEKYMLKEEDGCIAIYRIEGENDLILESVTDILTKYLTEEDLENLNNGIIVKGIHELTHVLEDFE